MYNWIAVKVQKLEDQSFVVAILNTNRIDEIIVEMHKILAPGEYGLGTEKESIPDDDKKAFERLTELRNELEREIYFTSSSRRCDTKSSVIDFFIEKVEEQ